MPIGPKIMKKTYAKTNPFTLINQKKVGLLDASTSYQVDRYPWAYEYWKKQQQVHWLGEEVPMAEDVRNWNCDDITETERYFLTQIFRLFTQSDIEVGENYLKRYIPIFQPLEIRLMMTTFANMETVHIDAYALLLKTLGMPNSEFECFREYTQMSDKISYMYDFNMKTCSDVSRTLAMFGAFTEGMSLFASFAMLLNFPRFNKMKGMGQIITWSVRDESLHCEAMVRLFHEWNHETGALTKTVQKDILNIAETMVSLEDKFIELAFAMGEIKGLTQKEVQSYIRFVADNRLMQLKLPTLYGYFEIINGSYRQMKEHPLPWLIEILNGVEHANFFEQRATEYTKVATQGEWHGEKGVWQMLDSLDSPK